jgi:hypothetical protein
MIKDYLIYLYPLLSKLIGEENCSSLRDLIDENFDLNDKNFVDDLKSKLNVVVEHYSQSDPNIITYKQWIRNKKIDLLLD